MSDPTPKQSQLAGFIQILQLVVLVVGVAGIFLAIGRRDQALEQSQSQISELRQISSDLARAVGSLSISDASQLAMLQSIEARLNRLELR